MAGRVQMMALACLVMLVGGDTAQAFGGRWWSSSYGSSVVVYYPVVVRTYPVVWLCQPTTPTVIPLVPQQQLPLATPVPAPPSPAGQTNEPPLGSTSFKGPTISESRSQAATNPGLVKEKCKVGFWNLTGQDITLKVDGQPRLLPRDRAITLELGRAFVWQVNQREPSSERVPAEDNFHEVIIRK
jgi:hypothetical protein